MPHNSKGTIVLVHGAWCDGSIWTGLVNKLLVLGYPVHAVQLPLTSFQDDIEAVERLLNHVAAPVLLVGHSYAGGVITAAGAHEKVAALAYVAAFAPDEHESVTAINGTYPGQAQLNIAPDSNGFLWLTPEFASQIAQDVDPTLLQLMVAVQKPTNPEIFAGQSRTAAWKQKPSSYLIATEDHGLSPQGQHALARRMGARIEEVAASHFVILSQPARVLEFLLRSFETEE